MPAASLVDALQDHCKALDKMASHQDFLALTGLEAVPEARLAELLERNLANSAWKRYHSGRAFKQEVSLRRERREIKFFLFQVKNKSNFYSKLYDFVLSFVLTF